MGPCASFVRDGTRNVLSRPKSIGRSYNKRGPFLSLLAVLLVGARGFEPPTPRSRTESDSAKYGPSNLISAQNLTSP